MVPAEPEVKQAPAKRSPTLQGLKENVIIGKLIPAGTGAKQYKNVDYELASQFIDEEPLDKLEDQLME